MEITLLSEEYFSRGTTTCLTSSDLFTFPMAHQLVYMVYMVYMVCGILNIRMEMPKSIIQSFIGSTSSLRKGACRAAASRNNNSDVIMNINYVR